MAYAIRRSVDCRLLPTTAPVNVHFFLLIEQIECHITRVSADEDDNLLWRWHMHQRMYICVCVCEYMCLHLFFLFSFVVLLECFLWFILDIFASYLNATPLPSIGKESKKCICFPTILGVVLRSVTVAASASAAIALLLFEHIFVCQQKSFEWWMARYTEG